MLSRDTTRNYLVNTRVYYYILVDDVYNVDSSVSSLTFFICVSCNDKRSSLSVILPFVYVYLSTRKIKFF